VALRWFMQFGAAMFAGRVKYCEIVQEPLLQLFAVAGSSVSTGHRRNRFPELSLGSSTRIEWKREPPRGQAGLMRESNYSETFPP
jgi:hypothetical protein